MSRLGTFFLNYFIIAPLGEGGMSEVYLGFDLPGRRFVALKFLVGVFATDSSAVGRLKREAEIYQRLDHPNVVKLVDTGDFQDGGAFLVQEFLRGQSVRQLQESQGGALEPMRAIAVLEDAASALHAAHRLGIVHRDIKPDNIMVGPDGRATVFDFGIAFQKDVLVNTQAGTIMGTLQYASPEAREGEFVDSRSDIFGLGAVFYEMLTGQLAIQAKTYQAILDHSLEDVVPPSRFDPKIPPEVDEIFLQCMADDPEDRYQSLSQLLVDLGKLRLEASEQAQLTLFGPPNLRHAEEALAAFREGQFERAKTTVARLLTTAPEGSQGELQHLMGRIQLQLGNEAAAVRAFERGLIQDPANLELAIDYCIVLIGKEDYEGAEEVLEELPAEVHQMFLAQCMRKTVRALPDAPPEAFQVQNRLPGWRKIWQTMSGWFGR